MIYCHNEVSLTLFLFAIMRQHLNYSTLTVLNTYEKIFEFFSVVFVLCAAVKQLFRGIEITYEQNDKAGYYEC